MTNKPSREPSRAPSSSFYKSSSATTVPPTLIPNKGFGTIVPPVTGSVRPSQVPLPPSQATTAASWTVVPSSKGGVIDSVMQISGTDVIGTVIPEEPPQPAATVRPSQAPLLASRLRTTATTAMNPLLASRLLAATLPPSASNCSSVSTIRIPTRAATPNTATAGPSSVIPGTTVRSVYTSPEDLRRATMQSRYHSLTPCERKLQDKWATQKADSFAPCPAGYPWERHPNPHSPGYQCRGGAHFMSDGILTEGIPGLYVYGKIHEHLPDHDRVPAKSEKIPDNFYGPVRPIGVDWQGDFTYMKEYVDPEKTGLLDPSIKMILGLGLRS